MDTYAAEARFATNAAAILDLLDTLQVRGTIFIVGRIAETHPYLVREAAGRGHEIACHSYDHVTIDRETATSFAGKLAKAKNLLEQVGGRPVAGFRAPLFSLIRQTVWATDLIKEAGFAYSSSVLPAYNPVYGFGGAPRAPFRWPNGLMEFPVPVASFLGTELPFLGGVYFRYLPWRKIASAIAQLSSDSVPWMYLHPYDFDTQEPFGRMPRTPLATNLICWFNRGRTRARLERVFADRSSARFCDVLDGVATALDRRAVA